MYSDDACWLQVLRAQNLAPRAYVCLDLSASWFQQICCQCPKGAIESCHQRNMLMNMRAAVLSSVLLIAMPLVAREKTDVLVMKNGDRLTCEIKGLNEGVLYVSFDYILGTSRCSGRRWPTWRAAAVHREDNGAGTVYTGTLSTAASRGERPVKIEVVESPGHETELSTEGDRRMSETSERLLAAVQWRHRIRHPVFQRKRVDAVQPGR